MMLARSPAEARPRLILHRAKPGHRPRLWPFLQRVLALAGLVLASPLFLLLYPLVVLSSRGPFFYQQKRPGLEGKPFRAWKIRTMRMDSDSDPAAARSVRGDDPRVTRIGRLLRELKLDELPQLWNVVRGEMELVGPRPIALSLQHELEQKIPGFSARLSVKPGLTSLPQICILESQTQDRVVADWMQRFEGERHYIRNKSPQYDLVILMLTVFYIFRKFSRKALDAPLQFATAIMVVCLMFVLAGCASFVDKSQFTQKGDVMVKPVAASPGTPLPDGTGKKIRNLIAVPATASAPEQAYHIGTGDILSINIFGEPGMDNLAAAVDANGMIQLPVVEQVKAGGLTVAELQKKLKAAYAKEFVNPWTVVNIQSYGSKPINLLGEFSHPGVYYMKGPTNVLDALGLGGGMNEPAYLKGARLIRDNKVMPVDVYAVLKEGAVEQNVWLAANDTLFIPSQNDLKAYVVGEVGTPGAVGFGTGDLTLTRALALTGGAKRPDARLSEVRIIRTISPVRGELILVNAEDILQGKAPDFRLEPDDIVYVGQQPYTDWNNFVGVLTPAVRLAGMVFMPFLYYQDLTTR